LPDPRQKLRLLHGLRREGHRAGSAQLEPDGERSLVVVVAPLPGEGLEYAEPQAELRLLERPRRLMAHRDPDRVLLRLEGNRHLRGVGMGDGVGAQFGDQEHRLGTAHGVEAGLLRQERTDLGRGAGSECEGSGLLHRVGTVRIQRPSDIPKASPSSSEPASGTRPGRLPSTLTSPAPKRASITTSSPSDTSAVARSEMKTRASSIVASSTSAADSTAPRKIRDMATDVVVGSSRMETASPVKRRPLPPPSRGRRDDPSAR